MNKIFKFGWRPILFIGADRELALITLFTCIIVSVYSFSIPVVVISALIWFVSIYFYRLMAKKDPLLRLVYLRHIRYREYYLAKSTVFCRSMRVYK